MRRRTRIICFLSALIICSVGARAGDVELFAQAGLTLPFYQQSFRYDPKLLIPANLPVSSDGAFQLDATGNLSFAGGLTWYVAKVVGFEARVDSAAIDIAVEGTSLSANLGSIGPIQIPAVTAAVDGDVTVGRLNAASLNLKLRTPGSVRFYISGGVSYMPSVEFAATARLRLSLSSLPSLSLPAPAVTANATLDASIGGNAGVGLQLGLGPNLSLLVEARAFAFPEQEIRWGPASGGASPVEQLLASNLDPIRFRPGFFQATAGLAVSF
jgi:hypothetical protein